MELAALATAISEDRSAHAAVTSTGDPASVLAELAAGGGRLAAALAAYLAVARYLPVDGEDAIGAPTTTEEPQLILVRIRGALEALHEVRPEAHAAELAAQIRADVPEAARAEFDDLLADARMMYRMRDERAVHGDRAFGCVARRALLEVGRRLVGRGRLDAAEHAVDLDPDEVGALLLDGIGPDAAEVAERAFWRANADYRTMPALFGPPPGEPVPDEWLPPAAARAHRAFGFAISQVFADVGDDATSGAEVRGIAAGGGSAEGTARILGGPDDLDRVQAGDVLVTTSTGPAFNLVLPLLAGLVTDQGGLLSHAAIVAREFALPAVVGCVSATVTIPDGARVRIDGTAGTVTVL